MSSDRSGADQPRALVTGRVLIDGEAEGEVMRLEVPLSFWGGVDPASGVITQPRHPAHGQSVAGKVLAMRRTIGSSSSSAILLELLHCGRAPAALLLGEPDAILALGVVVARELGYPTIPVIHCDVDALAPGRRVRVRADGRILA